MSTRETLTISLPPEMRQWIDKLVEAGGYASVSEYVRELVRVDRAHRAKARMSEELRTIIAENDTAAMTDEDWAEMRRQLRERAERSQQRKAG